MFPKRGLWNIVELRSKTNRSIPFFFLWSMPCWRSPIHSCPPFPPQSFMGGCSYVSLTEVLLNRGNFIQELSFFYLLLIFSLCAYFSFFVRWLAFSILVFYGFSSFILFLSFPLLSSARRPIEANNFLLLPIWIVESVGPIGHANKGVTPTFIFSFAGLHWF